MNGKGRNNALKVFFVCIFLAFFPHFVQFVISAETPVYRPIDTGTLPESNYKFFVAGHTYGTPGVDAGGLYGPFKSSFEELNSISEMEFGILTGDIVLTSTIDDWNDVDYDLKKLDMQVYFAAGNHDMANYELYTSRYGKLYYSFTHKDDLFIVLNTEIDNSNITGDQLQFLEDTLGEQSPISGNIFVFFHQLIWVDESNNLSYFKPNSGAGKADTTNFWSDLMPLFIEQENEVYLFAGDAGAFRGQPAFFLEEFQGVTFVASGMGGGHDDNFLIVSV